MSAIMPRCFKILIYFLTPEYSDKVMDRDRRPYYYQDQVQSDQGKLKAFFWIMVSIMLSLLISSL